MYETITGSNITNRRILLDLERKWQFLVLYEDNRYRRRRVYREYGRLAAEWVGVSIIMSRDRLRELIQELYDRHRQFHEEFKNGPRYVADGRERPEIGRARCAFFDSLNRLFAGHLGPLRSDFETDPLRALNEVIHFLEIDIPAFRCGYEKEWYLRKLKSVPLNHEQQDRLKSAALDLVKSGNHRREFRDWAKLMIVLADKQFVAKLKNLSESPDHFIQKNAGFMLRLVLENRPDLRLETRSTSLVNEID